MKKLLIIPILLMMTACSIRPASAPVPTSLPEETQAVANNNKNEIKVVSSSDKSSKTDAFSKIRSCEYDFNADGKSDTITLYSNTQVDEAGNIMWDDFHEWLLEVEITDGGFYTLTDGSISTGQIYFEVFEIYDDDVTPAIAVFATSGNGLDIRQFTYDENVFSEQTVYSTDELARGGINKIYSSVPFYK